jgi:hypothetical protein
MTDFTAVTATRELATTVTTIADIDRQRAALKGLRLLVDMAEVSESTRIRMHDEITAVVPNV